MLTFHELMGFMSPKMANQILDDTQTNNKDVYRALVVSMAQVLKARPEFLSRQPKERRHKNFVQSLSKPGFEEHAGNLIRGWLFKEHKEVLTSFLEKLEIEHEEGMVDDLPETMSDEKLNGAIDMLLENTTVNWSRYTSPRLMHRTKIAGTTSTPCLPTMSDCNSVAENFT